jgi:hypothetical protein
MITNTTQKAVFCADGNSPCRLSYPADLVPAPGVKCGLKLIGGQQPSGRLEGGPNRNCAAMVHGPGALRQRVTNNVWLSL